VQVTDTLDRVMVIVAHPDDAESWAGGTVARFALAGKTVVYVVVTSGEKGSADRAMTPEVLREIREGEQRNAALTLGVREVTFLRYPDCEVEVEASDLARNIAPQELRVLICCPRTRRTGPAKSTSCSRTTRNSSSTFPGRST